MENRSKEFQEAFVNLISNKGYNKIICSCYIASALQDNYNYIPAEAKEALVPMENPYYIGQVLNTSIWVNSHMKYSDLRILDMANNVIHNFSPQFDTTCLV